jgi:hypothetical protein
MSREAHRIPRRPARQATERAAAGGLSMLQQGQTAEFTRLTIIPNENNGGHELETGNLSRVPAPVSRQGAPSQPVLCEVCRMAGASEGGKFLPASLVRRKSQPLRAAFAPQTAELAERPSKPPTGLLKPLSAGSRRAQFRFPNARKPQAGSGWPLPGSAPAGHSLPCHHAAASTIKTANAVLNPFDQRRSGGGHYSHRE